MAAPSNRRVVVVGGGIAGLSVAHFLGRLPGIEATLVEREPRHNVHSSGRSAEIQRVAVPDPVTGALALETADLYADPASAWLPKGLEIVERTGLLVLSDGPPEAWHAELESAGYMSTQSRDELRRRAPHFQSSSRVVRWFEGAGRVRAPKLIASLSRCAMASGVKLLRSSGDASLEMVDGRVTGVLTAPFGRLPADEVVIAAGAWSRSLGESVGAPAPLRRTSRHVLEFERRAPESRSGVLPEDAAAPPIVWDDPLGIYVRLGADRIAVSPCDTRDVEPSTDRPDYGPDPATLSATRSALEACSTDPSTIGPVLRAWTGYRDLTPDDRPILGRDRRVQGLHWCAGLGGHGMTIGLAAGRQTALGVAAAIAEQPISDLVARCSVHRFD